MSKKQRRERLSKFMVGFIKWAKATPFPGTRAGREGNHGFRRSLLVERSGAREEDVDYFIDKLRKEGVIYKPPFSLGACGMWWLRMPKEDDFIV